MWAYLKCAGVWVASLRRDGTHTWHKWLKRQCLHLLHNFSISKHNFPMRNAEENAKENYTLCFFHLHFFKCGQFHSPLSFNLRSPTLCSGINMWKSFTNNYPRSGAPMSQSTVVLWKCAYFGFSVSCDGSGHEIGNIGDEMLLWCFLFISPFTCLSFWILKNYSSGPKSYKNFQMYKLFNCATCLRLSNKKYGI